MAAPAKQPRNVWGKKLKWTVKQARRTLASWRRKLTSCSLTASVKWNVAKVISVSRRVAAAAAVTEEVWPANKLNDNHHSNICSDECGMDANQFTSRKERRNGFRRQKTWVKYISWLSQTACLSLLSSVVKCVSAAFCVYLTPLCS